MKKNSIRFIAYVMMICSGLSGIDRAFSQTPTVVLTQPNTGAGSFYARDAIIMKPPFSTGSLQTGQQFRAYLDQNYVYEVNYQSNNTGFSRPLDNSLEVGAIPGTFSVSPNGASCYHVPIDVPPGTAGMQPGLSVTYNSQAGNGLLGVGFSLNGISYISRCSSNMFNDGNVQGVNFDGNDKFALDGQRLILAGTIAYGGNGAEYRTELESFSKVISYGASGSGPQYFKVFTRDGNVMEYGNTADSRIERQSSTGDMSVLTWLCNKVTDANGNYMTFSYNENNATGEWTPAEIKYTGNATAAIIPYNSVKFFYERNRNDKNTQYLNGSQIEQNNLLGAIKTYCEGSLVKEYVLSYSFDDYSHLDEISLTAQGAKLNTTVFKWGDNSLPQNSVFTQQDMVSGLTDPYTLTNGDFNGDGLTDVLRVEYIGGGKFWTLFIANPDINTGTVSFVASGSGQFNHDFRFCMALDMNTDGKSELLIYDNTVGNTYQFYGGGTYYAIQQIDSHNIYTSLDQVIGNNGVISSADAMPECLQTGDFDGDGFPEILSRTIAGQGGGNSVTYSWNIYGFTASDYGPEWRQWISPSQTNPMLAGVEKLLAADFDGDGKSEILKGSEILKWKQGNFVTIGTINNFDLNNVDLKNVKTGDFNGDGITDIAYRSTFISSNQGQSIVNTRWYTCVFNGKNNFNTLQLVDVTSSLLQQASDYDNYFDVSDFNGDGKSDILFREVDAINGYPNTELRLKRIYYSTGNNTWEQQNFNYNLYSGNKDIAIAYANCGMTGFMDCDNHADYYDGKTFITLRPHDKSQLITEIRNGFDVYVKQEYRTLLNPSHYSCTSSAAYPYVNMNFPLYVTTHVQFDNGSSTSFSESEYRYANGQSHILGKGFMGFETFTVLSTPDSVVSVTFTTKETVNTPKYRRPFPFILKTQTLDFSGNILKQSVYSTRIKSYGNRFLVYNVSTLTSDNISGLSNYSGLDPTTAEPDAYGNISKTLTKLSRGGTVEWATTTEYTFSNLLAISNGGWVLGLPLTEKTTTQNFLNPAPGDVPCVRNTTWAYYTNGMLKNKILEPANTILGVTELNEYFPAGLLKKISTTAKVDGVAVTRYTSYGYDATYRFMTSITNQLGHVTRFVYEPKYGNVISKTDANNLVTTCEYDKLGRLLKTTTPDGVASGSGMGWAGSGGNVPANALTKSTAWQVGVWPVITYYDRLGREIRTESKEFGGATVLTDKTYDLHGRLKTESLPSIAGSTGLTTVYTYQPVTGRILNKTGPAINLSYTYTNNSTKVTVTDNIKGISTEQITDAAGNIISSSDPGGTVTYNYYSNGRAGQVSSNSAVIATMKYDIMGRQTQLWDADAGTITYVYTGFGELQKQTDARGLITTMKYDNLGRVLQRAEPEGTTNYTYDTKTCGKGMPATIKLLSPSSAEINTEDFTYDNVSRLLSKKTTIKNAVSGLMNSYIARYSYDSYGRLQDYSYPSGFMIRYSYNTYTGDLAKIEDPSNPAFNPIWKCESVNALGQIVLFNKSGVLTFNSWDPNTLLINTIVSTGGLQNLHYDYNAKRQLTRRTYQYGGNYLSETFTYDAMNRLDSITDDWNNTQTISYLDNGNIQAKTGVGNYVYDADKIHAIKQITQPHCNLTVMPDALKKQDITYSAFGKVRTITEGMYSYNITYGTQQQRIISECRLTGTTTGKRKYYLGDYEVEENLGGPGKRELHYILAPGGQTAIVERVDGGAFVLHQVHSDMQGTWTVICKADGTVEQTMNFDAWGRRINPQTGEPYLINSMPAFMFDRGYTGHEHLDKFGLINMNGRMYDPLLGRMLSPDNFVQAPGYSQSYNRYSYCFNNPLAFTDPSGWKVTDAYRGSCVEGAYEAPDISLFSSIDQIITGYYDEDLKGCDGVGGGAIYGDRKDGYNAVWNEAAQRYDYKLVTTEYGGNLYNYTVYYGGELDGLMITYDCKNNTQEVSDLSGSQRNPMTGWPYQGGAIGDANWVIDIAVGGTAGVLKATPTLAAKGGVEITKHAAERMVERGITQKMVETCISKGIKYLDPKNGTFNYVLKNGFASGKDLLVGVSRQTEKVVTVIRGSNLVNNRFIPQ